MEFTKEQKLMTLLLCDIHKSLKVENGLDVDLISDAILSGNDWAIDWTYEGVAIPLEVTPKHVVEFVVNVLDMFSILDSSVDNLSSEQKKELSETVKVTTFYGFDGNNETDHLSVLRFLVKKMRRFTEFEKKSELNSHCPTLHIYKKMLDVYTPMRKFPLEFSELVTIYQSIRK